MKVLDGNRAAAYAVMMCQPDVVCAYPITPQTEVVESLYDFAAEGKLKAEMVEVECEHSAMGVLRGASGAGARTFTATSCLGLFLMFEPAIHVPTLRLPIVMVEVGREATIPYAVTSGEQDQIAVRDNGWIQIHAQSCQEIFDSIIMAYKLAEDPSIRIPVMVCYDGYFLSHLWEPVCIPPQEKVDRFLPPLKMEPKIDPKNPLSFGPLISGVLGTEYRYKQVAATQRAKARLEEIAIDFEAAFGRNHGGQIEEYRTEDADIVLVAMGSCAGTAKVAVDNKRDQGIKVGLVRIRMLRPFPKEKLITALSGRKAIGVIDRNVSFGWGSGTVYVEVKGALYDSANRVPMANFVAGLCGTDITISHLERAIATTDLAAQGKPFNEVTWLDLE